MLRHLPGPVSNEASWRTMRVVLATAHLNHDKADQTCGSADQMACHAPETACLQVWVATPRSGRLQSHGESIIDAQMHMA